MRLRSAVSAARRGRKNLSAEEKAEIAGQGGRARFAKMTAEERRRYAKRLVAARERKRREKR